MAAAKKPTPTKALKKSGSTGPETMEAGGGSTRESNVIIAHYGTPKCRKTTANSYLESAKWIVSDSNCVSTLRSLGRMPAKKDIYEIDSLVKAREVLGKMLDAGEKGGLGVDNVVFDSLTQVNDWHQADVAKMTNQRFLGDNDKNNGWQLFNNDFGNLLEDLAAVGRYANIIIILHGKEKANIAKGENHGYNLGPAMSLKFGRLVNWNLYQTCKSRTATEKDSDNDFGQVHEEADGSRIITETIIHTRPVGLWPASADISLNAEEPANMQKLLVKAGLL